MRLLGAVITVFLFSLQGLAQDDPRRAAVHARAELELEPGRGEPAWQREIKRALEKKISFELSGTPLCEAVEFLAAKTGVTMILDREGLDDVKHTPVTLKVTDMPVGVTLDWILKLADLRYVLKDGAVLITPWQVNCDVLYKIFDMRDLVTAMSDSPGLTLEESLGYPAIIQDEAKDRMRGFVGEIAERILSTVHPGTWAAELGTSIEERDGRLVVVQAPAVMSAVEKFLAHLREEMFPQVRVEAKLVAAAESLLEELSALSEPGEGTVYLTRVQLNLIAGALMDGKQAELVHAASVTCFNGQRNHTDAGEQVEYFSNTQKKHRTTFLGTVLDVRPFVSFDRKYVTMDIRLYRTESAGGAVFPLRVHRFRSRATCLDTDTFMIAGASMSKVEGKPPRRLVALVTPSILRLEPPKLGRATTSK